MSYLLSEIVPEGELFHYVASFGAFSEPVCRYFAKQLLQAMHYLHTHGFFHRDFKCENIVLDRNCDIKIVDYGFPSLES